MPRSPSFDYRKTPKGWLVEVPPPLSDSGRRERRYFGSRDKAKNEAQSLKERYRQHGEEAAVLPPRVADDATKALEILADCDSVSLCEAALESASGPSEEAKNVEELVRWALWLVAPDVAEEPSWLLMRDPTDPELKQTAELAALFFQKLQELGTREERKAFCQGVIDSAFVHRHRV